MIRRQVLIASASLLLWPIASRAAPAPSALPRYDLEIRLDPAGRRLEGHGELWIPATEEPRNGIGLGLSSVMTDLEVEVLEPVESRGAALVAGRALGDANTWIVRPARPFPAGSPVRLRLSWRGGEKTAFAFHLGPEASFASGGNSAWYPALRGGLATGVLSITVPAGVTVHATGAQAGTPEERRRGIFRYRVDAPSYFAFAAANYAVVRHEGSVPISLYLLKPRSNADQFVQGARKALKTLTAEFGPYPYGEFAIVETPLMQSDSAGFTGLSVPGFMMATAPFLDRFNLAYFGHEISHQWWGNLVRNVELRGRYMLDEAMAQYGSLRVVETVEGPAAAEQYRREGYPGFYPTQHSGRGYFAAAAAGKDAPLALLPDGASQSIAEGKGFQVWETLALTVGRDTFRRILAEFLRQHAFETITFDQFLAAIEKGSGRDLRWFYDQWFERPGAPDWQVRWRQEGRTVRGEVTQTPPFYRAKLDLEARGARGQARKILLEVDGPSTAFEVATPFTVKEVVLDPHFHVLHRTPELSGANTGAPKP